MANLQNASSTKVVSDESPARLRVLVVDHDITVLQATEQMSARYRYQVTTCSTALAALEILQGRKDCFDLILIEINMPDMDDIEFIQHLHYQMINIPVITMSEELSDVLKAIEHGACHFLLKPLHDEQFRNIWQHVIIKHESSMSLGEDDSIKRRRNDGFEFASSKADAAHEAVKAPQQSSSSQEINVEMFIHPRPKNSM